MKRFLSLMLVAVLALGSLNAEAARRLGGGKSMGQQSGNVTQREAARTPAAPAQNANTAAPASPSPAAPPAAAPKKPWGAMLGGLAAGLGLAWLASSLGLGAGFGQFLLLALVALVAFALISRFMRSRRADGAATGGYALQGAGGAPTHPATARSYSPDKVGNDASARPWESAFGGDAQRSTSTPGGAAGGSIIGSGLTGAQNWGVPAGFDTDGFLAAAKRNFVTLQDAWDRADVATLRSMMTDGMVAEIKGQLAEREGHGQGQPNKTEVVMLEAQLLGIEDLGNDYMASVEFNGMIREEPSSGPSPFREVWNMTKAKNGAAGWLVAGVQALQ